MTCDVCEVVSATVFFNGIFPVQLGRDDHLEIRATYCSSCQQILELLKDYVHRARKSGGAWLSFEPSQRSESEFQIHLTTTDYSTTSPHLRVYSDARSPGVLLDPSFISINRVHRWLEHCDKYHKGVCHELSAWKRIQPISNLLLVDVHQECLVEMPGTTTYCALSYVWGTIHDSLETRTENIELLKQAGSLSAKWNGLVLPNTIKDAIKLVRGLNQHYLWVDRLCIIQNDQKNKHLNVLQMDSIYFNAYFTIAAANGSDANYGLPGVVGGSRPRECSQISVQLPRGVLISENLVKRSHDGIFKRGWTFQERYLSPRTITFSEQSVYWDCQRVHYDEDTYGVPEGVAYDHPVPYQLLPFVNWPDMRMWSDMVRRYNDCRLSFPEDAQAAFLGIENILTRSFPAGFFCGLPEFFFDWALLWFSSTGLKRRSHKNNHTGHILPSWSWLGWEGDVILMYSNLLSEECWEDHNRPLWQRESYSCKLWPLVDWTHVGPSEGETRQIQNGWHVWEKAAESEYVPEGWKFKREDGGWYVSESVSNVYFKFPFPSVAQLPPAREQTSWPPYLRLRSSSALFTIKHHRKLALNNESKSTRVVLTDMAGQTAGILWFDSAAGHNKSPDQMCELVAISLGEANLADPGSDDYFPERSMDEILKTGGIFKFYNVLVVKWQGDYVVREGLGRVEKSIWDQQDLREVNAELH